MFPRADVDPQGLQEFSVVFTDRSLNHMSQRFQTAMRDVSSLLKEVYHGHCTALIPGGGSPEALRDLLAADLSKWGRLIKEIGIKTTD